MKVKAIVLNENFYSYVVVDGVKIGRLSSSSVGEKKLVKGESITVDWWGLYGSDKKGNCIDTCTLKYGRKMYGGDTSKRCFKFYEPYSITLDKKELRKMKQMKMCEICIHSNLEGRKYFVYCETCGTHH